MLFFDPGPLHFQYAALIGAQEAISSSSVSLGKEAPTDFFHNDENIWPSPSCQALHCFFPDAFSTATLRLPQRSPSVPGALAWAVHSRPPAPAERYSTLRLHRGTETSRILTVAPWVWKCILGTASLGRWKSLSQSIF